ncbi:Transcription factor TFIIIB component B'' [Colletotrichum chlorophyti]|uniref:Transcription factor TFIIIB component B n=1 Tax=Colletotrichum chlorophyti TaxID=708187 RepID=A0A1Q8S5U9_9PEZI|nr:Transcription factor TFIIIB component B'' [Colletotrichum chlorophyti]
MSSMFKKKGGLAFKPKMPQARPRAPGAAASQPPRAPLPTAAEASTQDEPPDILGDMLVQETTENTAAAKGPTRVEPTITPPSTGTSTTETSTPQNQQIADETANQVSQNTGTTEYRAPASASQATTSQTSNPSTESAPQSSSATYGQDSTQSNTVNESPAPAQLHTPPATAPVEPDTAVPSTEFQAEAGTETTSTANETTVKASAKRPRKRAAQTVEETEAGEGSTSVSKPKRPRKQKEPTTDGVTPKRPPRPRKKTTDDGTATEGAETDTAAPQQSRKPRRARSLTPEDAEDQEADLSTLTMGDLTRDLRIGKKFSRHDELLQRHRDKQAKARERLKAKRNGSEDVASESGTPAPTPAPVPKLRQPTNMPSAGPQFQIIDGQIVVDQNSLSLDRHAIAAAAAEGEDMLEIEENDFTTLTTQNSYRTGSKLKGPNVWTEEETELFYRGLQMFGTDFQMISGMFPGKNRRHVKMKFNREERHAPARVDAILIGEKKLTINLEEYKTWTKAEYEPVEDIMAAQRAQQAEFDAEQAKIQAAKKAVNDRNWKSLHGEGEGEGGGENEPSTAGAKPKPRPQAHVGPQITVDADGMITIDETDMDPDAGRRKRGGAKAKKKVVEYNMRGEAIN